MYLREQSGFSSLASSQSGIPLQNLWMPTHLPLKHWNSFFLQEGKTEYVVAKMVVAVIILSILEQKNNDLLKCTLSVVDARLDLKCSVSKRIYTLTHITEIWNKIPSVVVVKAINANTNWEKQMGNSSIYRAGTLPNKFNYEHKTLTATCCPEFTALTAICIEVHPAQVIAGSAKIAFPCCN